LWRADLQGADLQGANLQGADLQGANLQGANLQGADLWDAVGVDLVCPSQGAFTAWKKAKYDDEDEERNVLIKLKIPEDAMRSSATTRKCRCSQAKVDGIYSYRFQDDILIVEPINVVAHSNYDSGFLYKVGETVAVEDFEKNRWIECAPGIHFFITPEEAARY
ncbi:pentapeptide repeat-containing protein, partial [Pseudoramibacter alactolyticus]|uniref:pentapeptide repeat-containing protein n=1 Tax=Pseudoramibacter alactolyticus TaxID=113287 RepID=UPI00248E1816